MSPEAHDVTFPFYVEIDKIYNLACPLPTPKTPLGEGLRKTVEYFENLLQDSGIREMLVDVG
ncbi:MAG: hypothetical protein ABSE50_20065 [Xanthobacteraceae bacterium]|jgi:hypothetical protein